MLFGREMKISTRKNNKFTIDTSICGKLSFLNELFDKLLNLDANEKPSLKKEIDNLTTLINDNKLWLRKEIIDLFKY